MVGAELAESLDVFVAGLGAGGGGDVVEGALGVDRVVEDDRVDDQAERAQLFLLAMAVGLAQFAPAAVADVAGQSVAAFAAVELDEDAPPELLVVAVVEEVDRLRGAADVLKRAEPSTSPKGLVNANDGQTEMMGRPRLS